jgi:hypothetical protein
MFESMCPRSAITAAAKEGSDLVMVAEEGNKKVAAAILKNEPQSAVAAAFEKLAAQLTDAETGVDVSLPESVDQIAKSEKTFHSLVLRQFTQAPDNSRVDGEKPTQACPEALRPWSS